MKQVRNIINLIIGIIIVCVVASLVFTGLKKLTWFLIEIVVLVAMVKAILYYRKNKDKLNLLECVGLGLMLIGGFAFLF